MSKKSLQKFIKRNGGYILSDGTMNMQHLLPLAHDMIVSYNFYGHKELLEDIRSCFDIRYEEPYYTKDSSMWRLQYHGYANLKEDRKFHDLANSLWHEEIFNLFNEIAPKGYYFGANEGDGACIGWFKLEEEEF